METQTQTVIYFTTMCVEMDVRLVSGRADLDSENRSSRETENELTQALVEVFHRKPREGFQKARVAESLRHAYQCIMLQRGVRVCARAHSCVCVCVCPPIVSYLHKVGSGLHRVRTWLVCSAVPPEALELDFDCVVADLRRERENERQRDRETERQRDRERERGDRHQTDRQTDREEGGGVGGWGKLCAGSCQA